MGCLPAFFLTRITMNRTPTQNACSGFTLIELVAVLLILTVAGGSIMLRWAPGDQSLPAQADLFARSLRHAQAMATTRSVALTLDVQSADRYAITDGDRIVADYTSEPQVVTLENGVTLIGTDLDFDSLGRPCNGSHLLATVQTWVLTGNSSTATVQVQPLTGLVTVTP